MASVPRFDPVAAGVELPDEARRDRRLLRRLARGEQAAVSQIYERHGWVAYALAYRICGAEGAEDVVEEAFYSLWNEVKTGDGAGDVRARLMRLTRKAALDRERTGSQRTGDVATDDIPVGVLKLYDRSALTALAGLGRVQRECIELAYFDGFSVAEIATRRDLTCSAVEGHIGRGLEQMLRSLTPATDEH